MRVYLSLLKENRNYRALWIGGIVTQLGDWFNLIASAEVITRLTDSGVAVSYLFLARFLPLFIFSPVAGVLADRYSRKKIMVLSDLIRAVTVLCFLFITSSQQIWLFYVLTVLQFSLSALFTPARSAALANIVKVENLVTANALDSLTWSTMLAVGAFLGGLVAAVFGVVTAFIVDAMTFLLSAWAINLIIMPPQERIAASHNGGWLAFIDGLRYLWGKRFILGIATVKAAGSLIWGAINVLEVTFAEQLFPLPANIVTHFLRIDDGGTATLGLIYFASGLGTGLGPLIIRHWLGDLPKQLLIGITIGFVLMTVGILGLGMSSTLPYLLLATLIRTIGTGTLWVFSAAWLQVIVPDKVRGRVFAFEFALLTLTQSLSTVWAGIALDSLQLDVARIALIMGSGGLIVTCGWLLFWRKGKQV